MVDLRKEDGEFEAYLAEKGTVFNNEILVSFDDVQFPMTEIVRSSFKKVFGLIGMALVYEEEVDLDIPNLRTVSGKLSTISSHD